MAKPKNIYAIIQDRSGSMMNRTVETIGGFNAYVEKLKDAPGKNRVTLVQFDDEYTPVFADLKPKDVTPLDNESYKVRGMTALLDAVGKTLTDLDKTITDDDNVTVVIMTDGHENSSQEYSLQTIQKMIKEREEKGNWTFVYMGAGSQAWSGAGALGIHVGNTLNYGAAPQDHLVAFASLSSASLTRSARATKGERSTTSYFDPSATGDVESDESGQPVVKS